MARGDVVTDLKDIMEIQSHPAILEQCQDFLDATLPEGYRAVLASNTATAAEQVANSDEFGMYVHYVFFEVRHFVVDFIRRLPTQGQRSHTHPPLLSCNKIARHWQEKGQQHSTT
jgi:hypothetical protein